MTSYASLPVPLAFAVALGATACAQAPAARDNLPGQSTYSQRMIAESTAVAASTDTVYRRRMLDLFRRARLVHTDSLARLYASIPRTPDSTLYVLRQEIGCEDLRLLVAHGEAAQRRALQRMSDSLMRVGFAFRREDDRMMRAPGPYLQFHVGSCGLEYPLKQLPDSLALEPVPSRP